MCACKMFPWTTHTRRAVCSSIHVNIESKQSAALTLCGMGGALVALTFHYCNHLARELLYRWISCKKKSRISYYSLHVLDSGHYMCHAISTTGATLNAASPWYRPLYAPRLPPFPSLHPLVFTLHSSTTGHWCTPTTIETLATRFAAR